MQAGSERERVRLSREAIIEAALQLIEEETLEGFSFRKLAARLGCEAMSLYHHFPSKAHLLDALVDAAIAELPEPAPGPWRARIEQAARDWRALAHRRPGFFRYLALHRLNTPGGLAWLERTLALFGETGLSEEEATRMFRSFGYWITGAALDETSGYGRGPSAVDPPTGEVLARDYPTVAAAGRWFQPGEFDRTFEGGLALILDGIARKAPG